MGESRLPGGCLVDDDFLGGAVAIDDDVDVGSRLGQQATIDVIAGNFGGVAVAIHTIDAGDIDGKRAGEIAQCFAGSQLCHHVIVVSAVFKPVDRQA